MGFVATRLGWTSPAKWFAFFGFNSALVYLLIFLLPYQLSQYYTMPLPGLYSFQNASPQLLLVGWVILFQIYYIGYRLCPARPSRQVMTLLVAFPIFFSLILLFMYPIGANDLFEYIFRGHTLAHLHVNPMLTTPSAFPHDPLLPYVWWKDVTGTYGPLWELLSGSISWLVGPHLLYLLFAYKLLVTAHVWGSTALVYATLRVIRPDYAARGLFLFAWNPAVQFELIGNGHNDGVLIFWLLAAIYLLVCRRHLLSLLALTTGVLVKFIPLLLMPLFLIALWRNNADKPVRAQIKSIVVTLASQIALAALFFLPFGDISSTLSNLSSLLALSLTTRTDFLFSSVQRIVYQTLTNGLGSMGAYQVVSKGALFFMALVTLWYSVRLIRRGSNPLTVRDGTLQGSFEILFLYLSVAITFFHPWYITWLVAFAPFLRRFGTVERATLFCFTVLVNYFVWFWRWPVFFPTREGAETAMVLVKIAPPLLLTVGLWLYQRRSSLSPRLPNVKNTGAVVLQDQQTPTL